MNIFDHYRTIILSAIDQLVADGTLPGETVGNAISVEPPRDASHGDLSTNAAMVLAKPAKRNPRELADELTTILETKEGIESVEVAGPGFINLTLKPSVWLEVVRSVLEKGEAYGRGQIRDDIRINVEYVSANPTGPLHVGHCRGAVFGDALANLLEFAGFSVSREYYINDAGAQVDVLARSAYLRYLQALGEDIGEIPEGLYPGDYLQPVGETLRKKFGSELKGQSEEEWLPIVRDIAISEMMQLIREDLASLNIRHDIFFSERSLTEGKTDKVAATIEELREREIVYDGRLPKPKGKLLEDWEDREQPLFRATDFGDDVDRALIKSTGEYTYFASDMTYHKDKYDRGFNELIDVWGADHGGYVKRMQAAVKALTDGKVALDVKICQLVKLFRSGEPVKMSKRAGDFVTLRDVVSEVGPDPVRFMMIFRKNDAPLDFDFAKVTEQSRDNPVFYVQYAHARAHSIFRNAHQVFPNIDSEGKIPDLAVIDQLTEEADLPLIKQIGNFPRICEAAASNHEPHRIAFYLYDLASEFHSLWNRGKELPQLRFINESNQELTTARIALVAATAQVLLSGLHILGVTAVREMR